MDQGFIYQKYKDELSKTKEQLNSFKAIVEYSSDGIVIVHNEIVKYINLSFCNTFGLEREEIIGKKFYDFLPEKEGDILRERNRQRLKGEDVPSIYETKLHNKDGQSLDFEFNVNVTLYEGKLSTIILIRDLSERNKINNQLKESEARLKYAMDAVRDGLFDWNLETGKIYFSPQYYKMIGYKEGEFTPAHESFKKLVHPEDILNVNQKINEVIEGKSDYYELEFRLNHKDGNWLWIYSRAKVIEKTNSDKPLRIVGTHTNITNRKNAEMNLISNLTLMRTLISTLPTPIFYKNIDFKYEGCNKAFEEFTGMTEDEILGKTVFDIWEKQFAEIYNESDTKLKEKKEMQIFETKFKNCQGELKDVILYKNVYMTAEGKIEGIIGAIIEITHQKELNRKLEDNQKFLRSILHNLPIVLWSIDNNGIVTLSEGQGLKKFGLQPGELVGQNIFEIYSEDDNIISALHKALKGETINEVSQNSDMYFDIYISPLHDKNKSLNGAIGIALDITDKIEAQEEIQRYIEELQERNDLREETAAELARTNALLADSEEKLKELNQSKDKFFSIISHDLRSPFSSLMGLSEILYEMKQDSDDEDEKEIVTALRGSSQNIHNLLDNLLEWARIQLGRSEINPDKFDVSDAIFDIQSLFEHLLQKKEIHLINEIEPATFIYADPNMFKTILRNLVSNAIKFTPQKGIIKLLAESKENQLQICIEDSGPGMSQKDIDKLFRIDVHHTTVGTGGEKGTGLGLIICKEMVEKNKGKIWVESNKNDGCKFCFTLPFDNINGE